MIEEFDRQHVGAAQPAKAAPKPSATGRQAKALPADAAAAQADDPAQSQEAASGTHVQVQTSAFILLPDSFLLVGALTCVCGGILSRCRPPPFCQIAYCLLVSSPVYAVGC